MKLKDITEAHFDDDDLDDSDSYERGSQIKKDVEEVLVKLGFERDNIENVFFDHDESEVDVNLNVGIDGIPLSLLEKLRKSDMASEYYIHGHGNIEVSLRFKLRKLS